MYASSTRFFLFFSFPLLCELTYLVLITLPLYKESHLLDGSQYTFCTIDVILSPARALLTSLHGNTQYHGLNRDAPRHRVRTGRRASRKRIPHCPLSASPARHEELLVLPGMSRLRCSFVLRPETSLSRCAQCHAGLTDTNGKRSFPSFQVLPSPGEVTGSSVVGF